MIAVSNDQKVIAEIEKHILFVAKGLVNFPESVKVHRELKNGVTRFIIETEIEDVGKIIGKRGGNIQSLRTVCRGIAAKNKLMIEIEVNEG